MVDIFTVNDVIVSTVRNVDTNLLVYSSLAAYGSRRGGRLPGSWFVAALGPLGHGAAAVRQSLFRMERDGELRTERRGRHKLYRLSPFGQASVDAGSEKLQGPAPGRWDGRWTVCVAAFEDRHRALRDRLRDLLEVEGFAPLARGVMVHVRDRTARVRKALAATRPRPAVTLFRGALPVGESDAALVARLWNLGDIDRRYRRFLARHGRRASAAPAPAPAQAFAQRFAVAIDFLEVAWDDPGLPRELLPRAWSGHRARELARNRYRALLPATIAHGDAILAGVGGRNLIEK
jgi:phenylacetic acid degradation operon negative regulatory protein